MRCNKKFTLEVCCFTNKQSQPASADLVARHYLRLALNVKFTFTNHDSQILSRALNEGNEEKKKCNEKLVPAAATVREYDNYQFIQM